MTEASSTTLYARLGGYDANSAVADNLLPRLMADEQLGRFWEHRGDDGLKRETSAAHRAAAMRSIPILAASSSARLVTC